MMRALGRLVAVTGLAALAAGCSTIGVLNAVSVSPAVAVTKDIAYGPLDRQHLDV
jgi:hypothetical protein